MKKSRQLYRDNIDNPSFAPEAEKSFAAYHLTNFPPNAGKYPKKNVDLQGDKTSVPLRFFS